MGGEFKIARMHNSVYRDVKHKLDKRYKEFNGEELTAEQEDPRKRRSLSQEA